MQMKRLIAIMLFTLGVAAGQLTQTNVTKPTPLDSKPNSDEVPDGYAIDAKFERMVILRFKHKADLLASMEKVIEKEGIKNALILAGAGSVRNYHIHSVSNRDFPSKNIFTKDPTDPADLVSMNGYVIDGRIHAHMTLTNGRHAFGGHHEPETNVFTFAIVTLGVLCDDVDLSKIDDKTYR
jgi:predicted DNA-binding protein with PD1-like motif